MRIALAVVTALVSAGAWAAPRLESLSVKADSGKSTEVLISVSIERRTLLDLNCDAIIDPGDGGKLPMTWGIADRPSKTARYQYKKPGSYRLRVAGTGNNACVGLKEAQVTVGGGADAANAEPTASASRCPSGWTLVEQSAKGTRYTCRAKPPAQVLRCTDGTAYFSERGEIGCR